MVAAEDVHPTWEPLLAATQGLPLEPVYRCPRQMSIMRPAMLSHATETCAASGFF